MVPRYSRFVPFVLLPALVLLGAGCSNSTRPGAVASGGTSEFEGSIDPADGSFVLKTSEIVPPGGAPIPVALIGSNLVVEGYEVSLDVALENRGNIPLYAPGEVQLHDLDPTTVMPTNPDWAQCPPTDGPLPNNMGCVFGYDYSELLGGDGVLAPGETSGARTWRFHAIESGGFSFGATVWFGLEPTRAQIAGTMFADANENGVLDPGEMPFGGGTIFVSGPGKSPEVPVNVPESGRFSIPVAQPGFYSLRAVAPPTFAPVYFTTPNPLSIVLPLGPDGLPESYYHADFGTANVPLAPPILFHQGPGEPMPQAPYRLLGLSLEDNRLSLDVGFSGCGPEHTFRLYMVGGFMESDPVRARLVLTHDDFGELCDAYFERTLVFNLLPLGQRYLEFYPLPVDLLLVIEDGSGSQQTIRYQTDFVIADR